MLSRSRLTNQAASLNRGHVATPKMPARFASASFFSLSAAARWPVVGGASSPLFRLSCRTASDALGEPSFAQDSVSSAAPLAVTLLLLLLRAGLVRRRHSTSQLCAVGICAAATTTKTRWLVKDKTMASCCPLLEECRPRALQVGPGGGGADENRNVLNEARRAGCVCDCVPP